MKKKYPARIRPNHGVVVIPGQSTIVFVTVCTAGRKPILANTDIRDVIEEAWSESRDWFVGRYVIMPDHVHFFAAPSEGAPELEIRIRYWNRRFAVVSGLKSLWQSGHRDTRLRRGESYEEKWDYVRMNPVRRGLAEGIEEWPYQGEVFELRW